MCVCVHEQETAAVKSDKGMDGWMEAVIIWMDVKRDEGSTGGHMIITSCTATGDSCTS